MKKVLAMILATAMLMGVSVTSLANDPTPMAIDTDGSFDVTVNDSAVVDMPLLAGGDEIKITVATDEKDLDDVKLTLKTTKGKELIKDYKLDETQVIVTLNDYAKVEKTSLEFEVILKNKSGKTLADEKFRAKVGYEAQDASGVNAAIKMNDGTVEIDYANGDVHVVKFADGTTKADSIELTGPYFAYYTKAVNQDNLYMGFSSAANKAVSKQYESADLSFFNFTGKPSFDFTGEMTMVLPDEDKEYFLYSIGSNNELTQINAKLNEDEDALVFKTRSLSNYVLSDTELDTKIVEDTETEEKPEDNTTGGGTTTNPSKPNPETGSSDFVGAAAALAVVSVAAAGAVALKKKK